MTQAILYLELHIWSSKPLTSSVHPKQCEGIHLAAPWHPHHWWNCLPKLPQSALCRAGAPGDAAGTTLNNLAPIVAHQVQEGAGSSLLAFDWGCAVFCIPDFVPLFLRHCWMWTERKANSSLGCSTLAQPQSQPSVFHNIYIGLLLPHTLRALNIRQKEVKEVNNGRITAAVGHCKTTNYNSKVEKQSYCKEICKKLRTKKKKKCTFVQEIFGVYSWTSNKIFNFL